MPVFGTPSVITPAATYFYAVNGPWVEPYDQESLENLLVPIRSVVRNMTVIYDPPDDGQASIDWRIIRDDILPESQDWVDGQLSHKYAIPFALTKASGTKYDSQIVALAAYYCGHRIESRTYSGSAMPNDSPYAQTLLEQRDIKLEDLKTGIRLRGIRLKSRNRFCDPHVETYDQPGPGASAGKGNFQSSQNAGGV